MPELSDNSDVTIASPAAGEVLAVDADLIVKNKPLYWPAPRDIELPGLATYGVAFRLVNPWALEDLFIVCGSGSGTCTALHRSGGIDTAVAGISAVTFDTTERTYLASPEINLAVDDSLMIRFDTLASAQNVTLRYKIRRLYL